MPARRGRSKRTTDRRRVQAARDVPDPAAIDIEVDAFAKRCAAVAVQMANRRGIVFDYSEESLARVDDLLQIGHELIDQRQRPWSQVDVDVFDVLARILGGYVGEVVLRTVGGQWTGEQYPDGALRPALRVNGVTAYPMEKVLKRLTSPTDEGTAGYAAVVRMLSTTFGADTDRCETRVKGRRASRTTRTSPQASPRRGAR
jgi:hypothetical protein